MRCCGTAKSTGEQCKRLAKIGMYCLDHFSEETPAEEMKLKSKTRSRSISKSKSKTKSSKRNSKTEMETEMEIEGGSKPNFPLGTSNCDMRVQLHELMQEHVLGTFAFVQEFSKSTTAKGTEAGKKFLLQNQVEIGQAFGNRFGESARNTMTKLWTQHIALAVPVLSAASKNNKSALEVAMKNWQENAKTIAKEIYKLNSEKWNEMELTNEMLKHLQLLTHYSVPLLKQDFARAYMELKTAMNHFSGFADTLTKGFKQ
jgi:hypothetical protein